MCVYDQSGRVNLSVNVVEKNWTKSVKKIIKTKTSQAFAGIEKWRNVKQDT